MRMVEVVWESQGMPPCSSASGCDPRNQRSSWTSTISRSSGVEIVERESEGHLSLGIANREPEDAPDLDPSRPVRPSRNQAGRLRGSAGDDPRCVAELPILVWAYLPTWREEDLGTLELTGCKASWLGPIAHA